MGRVQGALPGAVASVCGAGRAVQAAICVEMIRKSKGPTGCAIKLASRPKGPCKLYPMTYWCQLAMAGVPCQLPLVLCSRVGFWRLFYRSVAMQAEIRVGRRINRSAEEY